MYYIRKFEDNLWHQYDYSETTRISAAALTVSLNTRKNALSLWKIADLSLIEKQGLLALIASLDSIDKIDIVIFSKEELDSLGLKLEDTKGITTISSLEDLHTDIVELDSDLLNNFAHLFAKKILEKELKEKELKEKINKARNKQEKTDNYEQEISQLFVRRYTKNNIIKVFKNAIDSNICTIHELSDSAKRNILK